MKRLKRIRLINWHRFTLHTFDVEGHLLLMGDNGSGKSTILDALQVGLVGNMRSVRLNLAANEGGDRSLKSYVLGLVGGNNNGHPAKTLRKNATGYILLEFADTETEESFVLGTVIDAHADGRSPDKEHFIARDSHLEDCPCLNERDVPHTVREFKRLIPELKSFKRYSRVEEYQQAVLKQLGGLDAEFFRLFISGMAFRKIRNLRDFVYDFLLPEAGEVQVGSLREAAERYRQLHALSQEAEQRIDLLNRIAANAQTAEAGHKEAEQLRALIDRAELCQCEEAAQSAEDNHARFQKELAEAMESHTACEAGHQTARGMLIRLQHDLAAHEKNSEALAIENRVERLADQIRHENRDSERLEQALRASREAIAVWRRLLNEASPIADEETNPHCLREELIAAFGPAVPGRVEDLDCLAADCLAGEIPSPDSKTVVRQVAEDWPAIGHWLQSLQFQVESQKKERETQSQTIQAELEELRKGRLPLPPGLVKLQQHLQAKGISSTVFCEVIEIADPALQARIENVLGTRRFDLLIEPAQFSAAMEVFQQIHDPEMSAYGFADSPRLMRENIFAREGSLAEAIATAHPLARLYADAILGSGFATGNLESHVDADCWAVTVEGFFVGDFAVRRLPAVCDHQTWPMGGGGISRRSESLQARLTEMQDRVRELAEFLAHLQAAHELFDRGRRGPELLFEDYELPSRLRELRLQYATAREEAAALKASDLGPLRQKVEQAETEEHQAGKDLKLAWGRQCVAEQSLKTSENTLAAAQTHLAEMQSAYGTNWPAESETARQCEAVIASNTNQKSWDELIAGWTEQLRGLQKSFSERHDDGVRLRTEYNNRFQFAGDCTSARSRNISPSEAAGWIPNCPATKPAWKPPNKPLGRCWKRKSSIG